MKNPPSSQMDMKPQALGNSIDVVRETLNVKQRAQKLFFYNIYEIFVNWSIVFVDSIRKAQNGTIEAQVRTIRVLEVY